MTYAAWGDHMSQTMNEIFDKYLEERVPLLGKRTQIDYRRHVTVLRKHFGSKNANDLTLDDVNAFMNVEKGKQHRNHQRAVLSAALAAAVDWRWIDYNIAKEAKRHPHKPRNRIVSNKELAAFKQKVGKHSRIILAADLARLTGLLQGAIIRLRWDQVHEKERVIVTRHHITDQRIEVPISDEVQEVLDRCKWLKAKKKSEFVLPTQFGDAYTNEGFRAGWQRAIKKWKKTGYDSFTFNDITKTGAREHRRVVVLTSQEDATVARFAEFDAVVKSEATMMSQHYKVFYCLEKSIRKLVSTAMRGAYGPDWWTTGNVSEDIKKGVDNAKSRDIDSGMDLRGDEELEYTTFGQLNLIISQNWENVFAKKLRNKIRVGNVMVTLNRIRGPIAHFSLISEHEVKRLEFSVAEWFDQLVS